ncbi:glutaredoxin family protein [Corynebacterium choanae]|uniref:Glutaredoxin-like domain (DUF836) n=1 Tax=Corynebacterium choanae TaxID=1862358 RepID=A0A3G6J9M9_9CORY|nr:glutaredoxin family protein [Corynebacterium choanae]AZA14482.1 hypothetical protein CCHOA_10515 [Corynebacterium choanae]
MSLLQRPHVVELLIRQGCGSCQRVEQEIRPLVAAAGCELQVIDVADDAALAAEFGDLVPVVLVDDEVIGTWECDPEELAKALL